MKMDQFPALADFVACEDRHASRLSAIGFQNVSPLSDENGSLSQSACERIVQKLDGLASPEQLHQDGERPRAQAWRLYEHYQAIARELKAYARTHGLDSSRLQFSELDA